MFEGDGLGGVGADEAGGGRREGRGGRREERSEVDAPPPLASPSLLPLNLNGIKNHE